MKIRFSQHIGRLAVAVLFGLSSAAMAQADDACIACHGDDGLSDDPDLPIIAGASDFYIESQLFLFSDGDRPCVAEYFSAREEVDAADHCAVMEAFTEDEMIAQAGYYAGQSFKAAEQEIDAALADQGESIHDSSCARCHSNDGGEALDDAGILAGQWKPYLIHQLEAYRAGDRWIPDGKPDMDISDEDIKALAEHYARAGL